jgi:thiamine-phosphate pyrophosphorylase
MILTGIYAITDDDLLPEARLYNAVEQALAVGISLLQYRSKRGTVEQRRSQAEQLQALCQRYNTPLLINDDVELFLQVGAAGVHLGQQDGDIAAARARLGISAIIGVTCHSSLDHALRAQQAGADYVAFGRFYPSHTKPAAAAADPAILSAARQALALPIVAIGGINADNGAALLQAGADMLALIHGLFGSADVTANTRRLKRLFEADNRTA